MLPLRAVSKRLDVIHRDHTPQEVVKGPAYVAGNSIGGFMCANLAVSVLFSRAHNTTQRTGNDRTRLKDGLCLFNPWPQADYPQLVSGLALINSAGPITPNYDAASAPPPRSAPPEAFVAGLTAALLFYLERSIPETLRKCYPTAPHRADAWLAEEIYRASCDLGAPQVFGSVFYLPPPRPLNHLVQRFGGPVAVLQGALDPLNDARSRAKQIGELCPEARIELLQAGHCPHDECDKEFSAALLRFVRDVEGGTLAGPARGGAVGSARKEGAEEPAAAAGR